MVSDGNVKFKVFGFQTKTHIAMLCGNKVIEIFVMDDESCKFLFYRHYFQLDGEKVVFELALWPLLLIFAFLNP